MNRCTLDANVILRFLVKDHAVFFERAAALFLKAAQNKAILEIEPVVLAEVIYVLESYFEKDRIQIANVLLRLLSNLNIAMDDSSRAIDALLRYKNHPVDFGDAWLAAAAFQKKIPAASFDSDLRHFPDITIAAP